MSKKQKNKNYDFKYKQSAALPKLNKIKTDWDLKNLYYKSESDPQIEKDLVATEKLYLNFAKKWRKVTFTNDPKTLARALAEYESLSSSPSAGKVSRYFNLRTALNAKDSVAQKELAKLTQRFRKVQDELVFFTLTIGKIPKSKQKEFLQAPELEHFRYYLERVFLGAAHDLSEDEEKIINLKSPQSYGSWVDMVEKIIANRTVNWKKQAMPIAEALETIDVLPTKEKKQLWQLIVTEMKQIGEVAEHEFNAIITDVRNEENLRGYKKPYSSTALGYEDSEKSIENLVSVVSDEGFKLSKKFYRAKANWHGVEKLHYTQKYESIGKDLKIDFTEAVDICRDVFYGVKNEYGQIFDNMLENGQIDVFPKAGKRGGAFMSSSVSQPTHVFLNHLANFKSLETLAHEMGHAIHSERSKKQSPFYEGHSITTAETASTLFENLLFDAVYSQADELHRIVLLHDRITRDIATIERQIAFFNCELEIHQTIEKNGAMTNEELSNAMYRHLKSYLGAAIELEPDDGYSYVYIPHLRYGFYVYTYSFGILMSTIMANHYKEDKSYADKIDQFLSAGQSDTVANIFKSIGIDTTKPDTFKLALNNHRQDINEFIKMVAEKKRK